jgi:mono/diheme cytochrome c family protein
MSLRNSHLTARRWLVLVSSIFAAAALWMPWANSATWRGTGSVSDLSFGKGRDPEGSGRSRSPYCNNSPTGSMRLATHAGAQEQEQRRQVEAQQLKNPEPKTAESIEAGKKLYQRYCASCHGPQGKGDGSLALAGGTPSDLTDETWDYGSTDGEIFAVIRDGVSSDMLAYKEKLTEKQIWQVVNFIRSLGPKPKEEK